jgi:group II intron reverse transcriptase/maturase
VETKLGRIADKSANEKRPIFTSLYHLINEELLRQCHKELDGSKAVGIDEVSKKEYAENLDSNIKGLTIRLKNKAYKPAPALRVYIPKDNGKMRPLGISIYEDKIVQLALKKILESIYEPKFLDNMYGFRPNRGCHNAIRYTHQRIGRDKISYIVDADIKGFFDHIDHDWMIKFLEYNIKDPNIISLVKKYLKAGIMDKGEYVSTGEGSAQGNIISPILANIYMHYVLILWYSEIVQKRAEGDTFLVVYADDFIAGFQYKREAEAYYEALKERMSKFGLELESSKSRLLEFGRFAIENRKARGEGKPETFDFLGLTFYCGKSRNGKFVVKLKTSKKKFRQKVKAMKVWLYENRDIRVGDLMEKLNIKLVGHYRYYGISHNSKMLCNFRQRTLDYLYKILNRRSNKRSYTVEGFKELLKAYKLPYPKIYVSLFD